MLEKVNLFEARKGGYWNYRVPGIVYHPTGSGGGTLLVTAEARRGSGGDWDGNDILLRRSSDGGRTWDEARVVVACEAYGPGPANNFVMISDQQTGKIHALYCHNYARVFAMQSSDSGLTFSEPVDITSSLESFRQRYDWRVIAPGPGHGIQLANGRMVVPVWMSTGAGTEFGAGKLGHRPSEVACIYSDDGGQSWLCGDTVVRNEGEFRNPGETVPVQLSDGRVLFNIRSESSRNRRLVSISEDGAHDWSPARFDETLLEPVCMGSILRIAAPSLNAAGLILFANPDNLENELIPPGRNLAHDRKRLTVKGSLDDCQSWAYSRVLEAGPSAYSDLAASLDGTIFCIYENGMIDRMTDPRFLTLAHFDVEWLING